MTRNYAQEQEQELRDRRAAAAAAAFEREVRAAFLSANDGATEADWERNKTALLDDIRRRRALEADEQVRRANANRYQ